MSKFTKKHQKALLIILSPNNEDEVRTYYNLIEKIEECKRKKDFNRMLMYCQMGIHQIGRMIEDHRKQKEEHNIFIKGHSQILNSTKHNIGEDYPFAQSIPAIEVGSMFWAIYENKKQLIRLKKIIGSFPELEPREKFVEKTEDIVTKIYQYIESNEGCLQKDLKKFLVVKEPGMIGNILYEMDLVGKVERKKISTTYSLSLKKGYSPSIEIYNLNE